MPTNQSADWQSQVNDGVAAAKITYNAMVSLAQDAGVPGFVAQAVAFLTAAFVAIGRILYLLVLFTFVGVGTAIASGVLQVIMALRQDGAKDFAKVTGECIGEYMGIDTAEVDFSAGKTPADSLARATQLGKLLVETLSKQFGQSAITDAKQGADAAAAMAGYGMNFATSNVFISTMVELLSDEKLSNFAELGEDITRVLGLPRLTHQALRPLVRNAIEHPYDRYMRSVYRADLLNPQQLVKAYLAGRISQEQCFQWLGEHGLSDAFIQEQIAQATPGLHEAEIAELIALGSIDAESAAGMLKADGVPASIAQWRLQLLNWRRLQGERNRILGEVLSQIRSGFVDSSAMNDAVTKLKLPQDEAQLWVTAAGYLESVPRRRIGQGEMLFLYEAAQVTLAEVQAWLKSEGFSDADQQMMLTYFELKAAEASHKTTGGAAAKAANYHKEHLAWLTDTITGLFSRPPTAAELAYWSQLLDTSQRTKADVKTELKALPSDGSAIPPGAS